MTTYDNQFLREYKLFVIGDGDVGKSALTSTIMKSQYQDSYDPTLEGFFYIPYNNFIDSYRRWCVIDGVDAVLDVLDIAGQEEYGAINGQYIRSRDGFVIVYSITSRSSFESLSEFYQQIMRVKDSYNVPIILVGNKRDLEKDRQVSIVEGIELAMEWDCSFLEVSTKDYAGVENMFYSLVREMRKYPEPTIAANGSRRSSVTLPTTNYTPDLLKQSKVNAKCKCLIM